jgi:hypothetical protein
MYEKATMDIRWMKKKNKDLNLQYSCIPYFGNYQTLQLFISSWEYILFRNVERCGTFFARRISSHQVHQLPESLIPSNFTLTPFPEFRTEIVPRPHPHPL